MKRAIYEIMPCGHVALVLKAWKAYHCRSCGRTFTNETTPAIKRKKDK